MKKRTLLFIIVIILSLFIKVDVYANPYNKTFNNNTNCTWYAWDQVKKKTGIELPSWGNASTWYDSAKKAGFEVGQTPKTKSIVVWSWYSNGKNYGHVGYVEKVSGNKIYVWDSEGPCISEQDQTNCFQNTLDPGEYVNCMQSAKKGACEYPSTYWQSPGDLIGYIYLDNVPEIKKTTKATKSTTTKEKTTTTKLTTEEVKTEVVIERSAYLSRLEVYPGSIKFDKNTFEYEVNIYTDANFVIIDGVPEDSNATIEGTGKLELNKGINEYNINVKNGDAQTTYTVIVNNSDEFKPKVTVSMGRFKNYQMPMDIMFGVVTGVTIFIFSYGIYKRENKKNIL